MYIESWSLRGTFEDNAADWVPSCSQIAYDAEVAVCAVQVAAGTLPELPSGFRLVFDPVDHENPYFSGFISAEQYTGHISRREIILSLPGTEAHKHDVNHIPGYQRMLGYAPYADLAQLAAANSVGNPDLCLRFADAHDHFADQMFFVYSYNGYDQLANFTRAYEYIHTLIELAHMNAGYSEEEAQERHTATFDELVKVFELAEYERWYESAYNRVESWRSSPY